MSIVVVYRLGIPWTYECLKCDRFISLYIAYIVDFYNSYRRSSANEILESKLLVLYRVTTMN